ncbi:hypothetical protein RJ639_013767 [Escallonia herrerae]|uniref:DUF4283 domain-containing protein n=1 Tax=Escallonia herrerae TaxID=1293975 RepID=A0AA88VFL8_9ASTE|nr:hypothetical protein RJ639_013767 [Escallonia herrerae]
MGAHLALHEWPSDVAIHEIPLHLFPFWVRICGLPPNKMKMNNAQTIANRLGNLLEIESSKEGKIGVKGYMGLRVDINIEDALPKGFIMKMKGVEDIWVHFRYERLPDLCFGMVTLGMSKNGATNKLIRWLTGTLWELLVLTDLGSEPHMKGIGFPRSVIQIPRTTSLRALCRR